MICRMDAFLKKIDLESHVTFNGLTILSRKPGTSIKVGKGSHFTSNFRTNLIGINRKCILATHRAGAQIIIGENCGFSGTVIGAAEKIIVGNNVLCGANTLITDFDWHGLDPNQRNTGHPESKPVIIEDNVWLGVNVIVLKGSKIGRNTIIGAGSVVTGEIPENVIAGGVPCKIIKPLNYPS